MADEIFQIRLGGYPVARFTNFQEKDKRKNELKELRNIPSVIAVIKETLDLRVSMYVDVKMLRIGEIKK